MAQVVPEATVYIKCWQAYVDTPQTPYVERSYDGVGLYGHEGDLTSQESIWPKLLPMVAAGWARAGPTPRPGTS